MKEIHSRGISDPDIKPLNIMRIDTEWKLMDLGPGWGCQAGK